MSHRHVGAILDPNKQTSGTGVYGSEPPEGHAQADLPNYNQSLSKSMKEESGGKKTLIMHKYDNCPYGHVKLGD